MPHVPNWRTSGSTYQPSDLTTRLVNVESELFNNAGMLPQLTERVENLEAARTLKAVDVGGFIFTDQATVEAWARSLGDNELYRFMPNFLSSCQRILSSILLSLVWSRVLQLLKPSSHRWILQLLFCPLA